MSSPGPGEGAGPFCASCGARPSPGDRFCTECGAPQDSAAPLSPPNPVIPPPSASPAPADDATRVLPVARVVEHEERFADAPDDRPAYRGPPPPSFNWPVAVLIGLGALILVLGLVLFVQAQDDGTTTGPGTTTGTSTTAVTGPRTSTVPLSRPTAAITPPTTLVTSPASTGAPTTAATTTTTAPSTTISLPLTATT